MAVGSEELIGEVRESLERLQSFDVQELPRQEDLGRELNFLDAVDPATEIVNLYKRLSVSALQDFPDQALTAIQTRANADYAFFKQIEDFSAEQQNPKPARDAIITGIENSYAPAFTALHPYISYSLHRSADFQRLDTEARATLQAVEDKSDKFAEKMVAHEAEASRVLDEIRNVAAEEGVTQQASYFRQEADDHDTAAGEWQKITINWVIGLGVFAILSLFLHKIPFLVPNNTYDSFQLGLSKMLIFGGITYMMILSAKNFMSHKHNAVINRHRQNALMTHRALVEAAGEAGIRDAVMIQAASCIFSPQPTGYTQDGGAGDLTTSKSIVEVLSKPLSDATKSSTS